MQLQRDLREIGPLIANQAELLTMRCYTLVSSLAALCAATAAAQAPDVTMCATTCPDGHRVTFVCSQGAPCNYASAPPSSSSSSSSSSSADYANFAFQMGQQLGNAIVNSMRESEQRAAAERARAEEAARAEKERAEAEARRQAEERARKDQEMYMRLSQSLRRVGSAEGDASIHRADSDSGLRIHRSTDYSELPALDYVDFSKDDKAGSSGSSVDSQRPH